LALAGERSGVVESGNVFLPRLPGLIRLAWALFVLISDMRDLFLIWMRNKGYLGASFPSPRPRERASDRDLPGSDRRSRLGIPCRILRRAVYRHLRIVRKSKEHRMFMHTHRICDSRPSNAPLYDRLASNRRRHSQDTRMDEV
jgi:hypothetical protein